MVSDNNFLACTEIVDFPDFPDTRLFLVQPDFYQLPILNGIHFSPITFWHARETRIFGFPGLKFLPWFGLSFISSRALMPLISVKGFFDMHGKRGFSGFPGFPGDNLNALPWFGLSFISSQALMPLISVKRFFDMHGKRGFSGFPGDNLNALPWFDLSFISSQSLIASISVQ